MSISMKSFPKTLEEVDKILKEDSWNATEMHKCGCVIKYNRNKDGAFIRERDWCEIHAEEEGLA